MSAFVNRRDLDFLLYEMLEIDSLTAHPRYAQHDRTTFDALLDLAQNLAEKHYLPLAAKLDANEPKFRDGKVDIIPEARAAIQAYADAGMFACGLDEDAGGLQLPYIITALANGMFSGANISLANYSFLTAANANLISTFCSDDQKRRFLPAMLDGRCFGTMCLSEPQAGSSLSDITTQAVPRGDGRYDLSGSKMWISGGDHELSDNILHLVLAKIPGGAPGVKGISLFVVPRYRVNEDASLGDWNNVTLAGLNHKMGQRGTVNCLLNFGEGGACIGEIVGEPGKGLSYMFHMMNEARILVGHGAVVLGQAGYLHSLEYARERPQGRHPQNKDPLSAQVPILEHADVKRMLLAQKAWAEGGQALVAFAALLVDGQKVAKTEAERAELGLLLDLLTPIVKSWPSEYCLEANKYAIQVLGGYGYTRDYPVERYYRDNRLNHIHEGAYGIQGIDLLARKVRAKDGAAVDILLGRVQATIAQARSVPGLSREADDLEAAIAALRNTTQVVAACDDLNLGLANATLYLDAFGQVVVGWLWLWQATIAMRQPEGAEQGDGFYGGKLAACRYFFRYELPGAVQKFALVAALDDTCLAFRP